MSDTDNQQPKPLDPDVAYGLVHREVYSPVFFTKLATDFGIRPESEQNALDMLTMAAQLREAHDQRTEKQGTALDGMLAAAQEHLGGALAQEGISTSQPASGAIDKAAGECATRPNIAHAILSLQAAATANAQAPAAPA